MPASSISSLCANICISFSRKSIGRIVAPAVALIAACTGASAQAVAPTQTTYTITDLGALPHGYLPGATYGYAINAAGDVAGAAYAHDQQLHAVIFRDGKVRDLGVLPNANASIASGINGYDEVTGYLQFPTSGTPAGTFTHAFLYSRGEMKDIGTLPGDNASLGNAINDSAQVTGSSSVHGFLYSAATMTNLTASYGDSASSNGQGINSAGQVAGWADLPGGSARTAAVFSDDSVTLLSLGISPSEPTQGYGMNDSGQVTGWLYHGDDGTHAFLYSNSVATDLGTLPGTLYSWGNSMNASGQIVGDSQCCAANSNYGFLYTPGQGMINLNSLLPADSGWTITDAEAINDKGQITGWGINPDGLQRAFLLSPVFIPFSRLEAVADITGTRKDRFTVVGALTLSKKSTGIQPSTDTVVLQLDGYHIAIPPASFTETHGHYSFKGNIGNVAVEAVIQHVIADVYLFELVGNGAAGLPAGCSLDVVLTIGTNTGAEKIRTESRDPWHSDCHQR
jgi:probable HAF family extracellular repeat protein